MGCSSRCPCPALPFQSVRQMPDHRFQRLPKGVRNFRHTQIARMVELPMRFLAVDNMLKRNKRLSVFFRHGPFFFIQLGADIKALGMEYRRSTPPRADPRTPRRRCGPDTPAYHSPWICWRQKTSKRCPPGSPPRPGTARWPPSPESAVHSRPPAQSCKTRRDRTAVSSASEDGRNPCRWTRPPCRSRWSSRSPAWGDAW